MSDFNPITCANDYGGTFIAYDSYIIGPRFTDLDEYEAFSAWAGDMRRISPSDAWRLLRAFRKGEQRDSVEIDDSNPMQRAIHEMQEVIRKPFCSDDLAGHLFESGVAMSKAQAEEVR